MFGTYVFSLQSRTEQDFFSSRSHAALMRKELERQIVDSESVTIDFSKTGMTQSFADELVGVLAFHHGPELLKKLKFKGCSDDSKQILNFVVHQRLNDRRLKEQQLNSHYSEYLNTQTSNRSRATSHRVGAVGC
jgi:hypothetical protein